MRMSGTITLGLLSAAMLTAGCGGSSTRTAGGRVFYDANRSPVPRNMWLGPDRRVRQPLFDANGNPVPEAEVLAAYNSSTSYSSSSGYRRSSVWWGPTFYSPRPSYGAWTPSYSRPAPTSSAGPGRTYFGGSRPNSSAAPSSGSRSWFGGGSSSSSGSKPSSGGSVSRGGIGGSGSSSGGSSAS